MAYSHFKSRFQQFEPFSVGCRLTPSFRFQNREWMRPTRRGKVRVASWPNRDLYPSQFLLQETTLQGFQEHNCIVFSAASNAPSTAALTEYLISF